MHTPLQHYSTTAGGGTLCSVAAPSPTSPQPPAAPVFVSSPTLPSPSSERTPPSSPPPTEVLPPPPPPPPHRCRAHPKTHSPSPTSIPSLPSHAANACSALRTCTLHARRMSTPSSSPVVVAVVHPWATTAGLQLAGYVDPQTVELSSEIATEVAQHPRRHILPVQPLRPPRWGSRQPAPRARRSPP